jgi:hypothetical protein
MTGLTGSPFIGVIARAHTRAGYVHNGKTRQTRHVGVAAGTYLGRKGSAVRA